MCNTLIFMAYILLVIQMKKRISAILTLIIILGIVLLSIFIKDKGLVNKITIFLSAILALIIAYFTGLIKRKNGLINGLIVGISIATISLIIHYFFAKNNFNYLYLRSIIIILGGASGGILGVNKNN